MIGLAALGLGLAGLLNRLTAMVITAPGLALGWLALRNIQKQPPLATTIRPTYWHWLWLAAAPFLAVSLIGTMVPPGLIWNPEEPHGYDVVEYHLQVPREWYEAGRVVPLKHNVFSYFPMGVEVHYLLAMEIEGGPWEGMYLAQLMHLALIVLTVLAAWGVARQFASSRASATVAAVALATIPWMAQLGAIAYNEGGLLLYGTLAIGWAMKGLSVRADSRSALRRFALAGAMVGFACGTKLTAVPELLLGLPAACIVTILWPRIWGAGFQHTALKAVRSGLTLCVVFGIAGLLTFSPWLARNIAWVRNPVFPEATSVFGKAHLTDVQVERLKRANHEPGPAQRGAIGHARAVWDQLLADWQFGYLLLPLGVICVILLRKGRRPAFSSAVLPPPVFRGREQEGLDALEHSKLGMAPPALLPTLMLLFLTIFWIGFTHLQSRFFLLAGPLAVILIAQVEWGRWLGVIAGLVILAAVIGWWGVNKRFIDIVWKRLPDMRTSLVDGLGRNSLQWLNPAELDPFPRTPEGLRDDPNAHIVLVGDSRAFYYQVPMSRLRYRTIFDLDTTGLPATPDAATLIAAWAARPPGPKRPPGEWLVIDGVELERFSRTYFAVPPPPPEWRDRRDGTEPTEPLVVKPER
jgi:hypothetical protein